MPFESEGRVYHETMKMFPLVLSFRNNENATLSSYDKINVACFRKWIWLFVGSVFFLSEMCWQRARFAFDNPRGVET
jgi:hypothetical protein